MYRSLKAALAAVIAATSLTLASAAPAHASSATLTFTNGVLYSGCFSYPYEFTFDLPQGTTTWDLDITIAAPDGTEVGSDAESGTGRSGSATSEAALCGSRHAGQLTASGVVTGGGPTINDYELEVTPTVFDLRRPYSRTSARLAGRPECGKSVTINVTTLDERPNGFFPAQNGYVNLQKRDRNGWHGVEHSGEAVVNGATQLKIHWRKPKTKPCRSLVVRARTTFSSDHHASSKSAPITIG